MSVYARFKKDPDGFRHLVELLETTPVARRERMIEVGMMEDSEYTELALSYMITFDDILGLNEMELAELVEKAQPRITALAISLSDESVRQRFLHCARPQTAIAIRDFFGTNVSRREVGGAQLSLISVARGLEKEGHLPLKKIPLNLHTSKGQNARTPAQAGTPQSKTKTSA